MAIVINEFEVAPERPEPNPAAQPASGQPTSGQATEPIDLAQRLARLEERELRLEAS